MHTEQIIQITKENTNSKIDSYKSVNVFLLKCARCLIFNMFEHVTNKYISLTIQYELRHPKWARLQKSFRIFDERIIGVRLGADLKAESGGANDVHRVTANGTRDQLYQNYY